MSTTFPLGAAVTWQPTSNTQRTAQRRFGREGWAVAREGTHTMISGEVCVLLAPAGSPEDARWVRAEFIRLAQPEIQQQKEVA
jgi:hypothetical protein